MLALKKTPARHPSASGFTLIELLVTIAIAAILLVVGVPSFVTFQRNSELTSAANSLLASLNTARSEAMKRNAWVAVTPLSGGQWSNGWRVAVDTDQSGSYNSGDIEIITRPAIPDYFTTSGSGNANGTSPYVLFNGSGYAIDTSSASGNLTITLERSDLSGATKLQQTRRVIVAVTGRVRVCRPSSSSDTSCASSTNE